MIIPLNIPLNTRGAGRGELMPDFKSRQWFNLSPVILMEAAFVQIDTDLEYSKRQSFLLLNFTVMPCPYFTCFYIFTLFFCLSSPLFILGVPPSAVVLWYITATQRT